MEKKFTNDEYFRGFWGIWGNFRVISVVLNGKEPKERKLREFSFLASQKVLKMMARLLQQLDLFQLGVVILVFIVTSKSNIP